MFQMGGQGNAAEVLDMIQGIAQYPQWRKYFADFTMPYFFQGPGEYRTFLIENGFEPSGVRSYPRDMEHLGREAFHGWLRTTWFPYTDCLPEHLREVFLQEVIDRYLDSHPADANGNVHVKMVRLEVEAVVVTR
jgi:trans-aconitate 2-methyltransferase